MNLDVRWICGDPGEPPIQVHAYDPDTFVLRQGKATSFEAPFLYLLFGDERALLLDTGATADASRFPLRATVDGIVSTWLADHPRDGYGLVVAHTHAHGDHVAGDAQFADRPNTTVVGTDLGAVQSFFGISAWPGQIVSFDLGGRALEITGTPGHHPTSLAIFDPATGFLLTGDTVYPGRLYAFDMPAFVVSIDRLVAFAASRAVTFVMGAHVEMSRTPRRDYPIGARHQPDEHPIELAPERLATVQRAAHAAATKPGVHVHDDFVLFNGTGRLAVIGLILRSLGQRLSGR